MSRNLKVYPITDSEVFLILENSFKDPEEAIGNPHNFVINAIIEHFEDSSNMKKLLKSMEV